MYILANMWFQNIMRTFFFSVDKIVFGFISTIYDLLITIARTSVLSQADILDMADRVYKLLAVFMVFKVTFSLIMYVVNPDDFSDKSKGVSKLGMNIVFSLAMLILTPYIFNYAYQLQTIILEDNSLAALVFGEDTDNATESPFNTAGDTMAFITLSPFFTPNISITNTECANLIDHNGNFNSKCSGYEFSAGDSSFESVSHDEKTLREHIGNGDTTNPHFTETDLKNYVAGVSRGNLGLMFRLDMAVATDIGNANFIMDYRYIFSTIVGAIVVLLLLTFCMDVALRSIKLAFLQLIAPIPILSYVDPKSGKDGMFKKWYQMCFKTYLSLFLRLLALYFAVYIISRVDRMVDIVDGSYQTNMLVKIFIIIGALMFAKSFTKILEGLGLKLDGGFTLNPLKKMENEMLGGKTASKVAGVPFKYGARAAKGVGMAGLVGATSFLTGQGFRGLGRAFVSSMRGDKFGKNFSSSYSAARARKKQVQQMKLDGVKPSDVVKENLKNALFGGATAKDQYDTFKSDLDAVTGGYKNYYSTVLSSDKLAKEFERRRIAAENAGNDAEAKLWQDSIDNRVKFITESGNKIALNDKNNLAYDTAQKMIDEFRSTGEYKYSVYGAKDENGNKRYDESQIKFDESDIVDSVALKNIQTRIEGGVAELNGKFDGKFAYDGGLKLEYDDDGNMTTSLKSINGMANGYTRAAENSDEKARIDSTYKYVKNKSNK